MCAVDLEMDSPEAAQRLCRQRRRCRARALEEERVCVAEAERYPRVAASMLCHHRPLFPVEAAEQETQRTARAAGWDRSAEAEERSCHRPRQSRKRGQELAAAGTDLDPWAREAGTL